MPLSLTHHTTGANRIKLHYVEADESPWVFDPEVLTPEDLATYVRTYQKPGTVRGAPCATTCSGSTSSAALLAFIRESCSN